MISADMFSRSVNRAPTPPEEPVKRAAEVPLSRVEKRPVLRLRQGIFAVLGQDGRVLRRGHDLAQVLRVLEKVRVIE